MQKYIARSHEPYCSPASVELEYDKDVWDARNLPGARYSIIRSVYKLNFTNIPISFRPLVKAYIRFELTRCHQNTCRTKIMHLHPFAVFWSGRFPDSANLNQLTREDVESYLAHLETWRTPQFSSIDHEKTRARNRHNAIWHLEHFLRTLRRLTDPGAPLQPIWKLIQPGDYRDRKNSQYDPAIIPEEVLSQFDQLLDKLTPQRLVPAVILVRALGWRASDVLMLQHDTCLQKVGDDWWIIGVVTHRKVQERRVPVSEEVAKVVMQQRYEVLLDYPGDQNPHGFLFPSPYSLRRGLPMTALQVARALRRFSETYNILDENGNVYHFDVNALKRTRTKELETSGGISTSDLITLRTTIQRFLNARETAFQSVPKDKGS